MRQKILIILHFTFAIFLQEAIVAQEQNPTQNAEQAFSTHFLQSIEKTTLDKLDPFLKLTLKDGKLTINRTPERVRLMVRVQEEQTKKEIEALGGVINTDYGKNFTLEIEKDKLPALLKVEGITKLHKGARFHRFNDRIKEHTGINKVHQGAGGLSSAYTGKGVVIGIIDDGVDFTHADFRDSEDSTKSRIAYLWNQVDQTGTNPTDFSYGSEWSRSDIEDELAQDNPNRIAGEYVCPLFGVGHGTHVTGTAAGNRGMAPEASLIIVTTDLSDGASLVDAVEFINKKAKEMEMPCVINTSWGTYLVTGDGEDYVSFFYDEILANNSQLGICAAAGNSGPSGAFWAGQELEKDTIYTGKIGVETAAAAFYIPHTHLDSLSLRIMVDSIRINPANPLGDYSFEKNIGTTFSLPFSDLLNVEVYDTSIVHSNGDTACTISVFPFDYSTFIPGYPNVEFFVVVEDHVNWLNLDEEVNKMDFFRFEVTGTGSFYAKFDGLPYNLESPRRQGFPEKHFTPTQNSFDVGSPAVARNVLAVGAYTNRENIRDILGNDIPSSAREGDLAVFSSAGPSIDGRVKPEITAPGESVASSLSRNYLNQLGVLDQIYGSAPLVGESDDPDLLFSGTSMAAPVVTGTVALIWEANPNLTFDEVKELIYATAKTDNFTQATPNPKWGYGKVDALGAVSVATGLPIPKAEQWNKIASAVIPIGQQATTIKTADDNTLWLSTFGVVSATEFESSILKSLDGGSNWEVIPSPELSGHHPTDIAPISESIAYVGMLDAGPDTEDGNIADGLYKTSDGGQSWTRLENYPYSPVFIHFFNEQEGWVMGEAEDFLDGRDIIMSTTSDGGQTWSHAGGTDWTIPEGRTLPVQDMNEDVGLLGDAFTGSYDVVGNTIKIGTTNRIWTSSDKGQNWSSVASPLFTNDTLFTAVVAMKDEQTFVIASALESFDLIFSPPKAYGTTDGGTTWIESSPSVYPADIAYLPDTDQSFIISSHFEFAPQLGTIGTDRTDDLQTWEYVDDKAIITMDFAEKGNGIGVFGNFPNLGTTGSIYNWGEAVIPAYEAAIDRASQYKYTEVTLNQLEEAVVLNYAIQSIGLESLANTTFHFEVVRDGAAVFTDSMSIATVDSASTEEISFTYLPDELGFYEFKVAASQADIGTNFFQDIQTLNVNATTLNKDDSSPESGISLQFITPDHYGYLGTEFKLINPDQVQAITLFVIPDTLSDFHIVIKEVDENGNAKEGEVFKSAPISGLEATVPGFIYTYEFEEPLDLLPGRYIFAVGQDQPISGALVFGFDASRVDENFWSYNPVDEATWLRQTNGTLMFRVHLGDAMTTSAEEEFTQTIPLKVFPVPFQEVLYIQLDYSVEPTARLQLFDATGRLWGDRVVDHHQLIRQDVRQLPEGMYFLRISSGNYLKTVKLMKRN